MEYLQGGLDSTHCAKTYASLHKESQKYNKLDTTGPHYSSR